MFIREALMADTPDPISRTVICLRLIDKGASVLIAAIYGATIVGAAYFASLSVGYLAGQDTGVFITYLTDTAPGITVAISLSVGSLGVFYGLVYRALHKRAIGQFTPQLAHYQKMLDPNRSSSGLPPDGSTNPDDL